MVPTVLVTGATGYIASELVAQLLDKSRFGEPIADPIVTRFDLSRMQSLGVPARSVRQILQESLEFFRARGELP